MNDSCNICCPVKDPIYRLSSTNPNPRQKCGAQVKPTRLGAQATYIKYARDTLFAASVSHAQSQLGSADAEIKVPCVENQISEMS